MIMRALWRSRRPNPVAAEAISKLSCRLQRTKPMKIIQVYVEGQTSQTTGDYTLDMDFKVAMSTTSGLTEVPVVAAPTWTTGTVDPNDDTTLQIKRIAADGNTDEDYFLFTPANSGLLTVNANNDADGSTKDADTSGTLFGAMETGPMMEMRTGQIATDSDSGPGNHFSLPYRSKGVRIIL